MWGAVMEEKKNKVNWRVVLGIALVVVLVLEYIKISELTNEISNLKGQIAYWQTEGNNIRNEINSIYDNVDERLKQEASLISSVTYDVGKFNSTTHQAEIHLKVVPKNITDEMILSARIGNETADFSRNGDEFTATLKAGIFMEYGSYPMLSIKTAGSTLTEQMDTVDLSLLHYNYLPNVMADIWGSSTHRNGSIEINGNVSADCKPFSSDCNITLKKVELVTELDGKEIARRDLTPNNAKEHFDVRIEETYKLDGGKELAMHVDAEDTAGYIHRSTKYFWLESGDTAGHPTEEVTINGIYDKEGNLLTSE